MLICIIDIGHHGHMEQAAVPHGAGISDEQVASSAPLVRALAVARYEAIWRACEPHIDTDLGKPDPRFIEAGIRVVDRLVKLYRLESPQPGTPEPDTGSITDARGLVAAKLEALEARLADLD